jgi:uncharacterized protein YgbK (DUF1537 family)
MSLSESSHGALTLPRNSRGLAATYYGDDFTGSTDVMEACVRSGLRTVLFLDAPSEERLNQLGPLDVVGVAGLSRSWTPEEMNNALPKIFRGLKGLDAPIFHYKICSTFDSSPQVGSIGRALEIAREVFGAQPIPLVVGAPILKRYTAFGNLFASADGVTHRIDRHPTMAHHPVTPMGESDLRIHLGHQTTLRGALVDVLSLKNPSDQVDDFVDAELSDNPGYVLFDVLDDASLTETGRQLLRLVHRRWEEGSQTSIVCGSSGVEYALSESLMRTGNPNPTSPHDFESPPPAVTLVVVGSRSPVTAAQTAFAIDQGFVEIAINPMSFLGTREDSENYRQRIIEQIVASVVEGANTIVTTPPKTDDSGIDGNTLGQEISLVIREVLQRALPQRLVVAGGDTSGHIARAIEIDSLTVLSLMAPGAPLCAAQLKGTDERHLEVCLKGGQVGPVNYFVHLAGTSSTTPNQSSTQERAKQ